MDVLNPLLQVEGIGQIGVVVRDLAQSKDFYGSKLGIQFLFDAGSMAFFQCGAVRLMLATVEPGKSFSPAGTILYFRVADIHASHASLEAQGIGFIAPPHLVAKMPDHELWMAFLNDPDENVVGLMSEVFP